MCLCQLDKNMKPNEVGCDGHMADGVPWTSNCNVVNIGKNYVAVTRKT